MKDTSKAAKPTEEEITDLNFLILAKITLSGMDGLTGSELASMLNRDKECIRPRLTELQPWKDDEEEEQSPGKKRLGMTVDSGHRRKNEKGNGEVVWLAKSVVDLKRERERINAAFDRLKKDKEARRSIQREMF